MNVGSSVTRNSPKLETTQGPSQWHGCKDIFTQWNSENGIQTTEDPFREKEHTAAPDTTG